jgi:hypothetical protein
MLHRLLVVLLVGCGTVLLTPAAVTAQSSNLDTVEGPAAGERTTLMITPHTLTDDVSARALGVKTPTGTRWALTLIGVTPDDSLQLILQKKALPIEDIERPAEGEVGPTQVYLSQETFLTLAETSGVRLHIGDQKTKFPPQMRTEMLKIFEEVV